MPRAPAPHQCDATDPTPVMGWIKVPQRSSLLPYRGVLSLGRLLTRKIAVGER